MDIINTIVLPHLNNKAGLLRCLDTLYEHTPHNFRVILIDQSQDEELYGRVKDRVHLYIKAYRNLGFAKAANQGILLASTKFVTVLNDDVEFINKKWWDGVMQTFRRYDGENEENAQVLCVNPSSTRKLNATGVPVNDKYNVNGKEFQFEYKEKWTEDEYNDMIYAESGGREAGIIIDGITPWCVVFHREGLLKVGLFDEAFYPGGGEDYDLQNRAYLKHHTEGLKRYRCLGSSLSVAWHWWGTTKVTQNAYETFITASALYQKKWGTAQYPNPYPNGTQSKKLNELELPEWTVSPL